MKNNVLDFPQRKKVKSDVDELQLDSNGFILRLPLGEMKFEQAHEELMNTIDIFSDLANSTSISRHEAFELKKSGEKIRECLAIFANMIILLEAREQPTVVTHRKEFPFPEV